MKKMIFILITIVLEISGNAFALDMNQIKIHGFISQGYLQTDKNDFYFAKTEDGTFQFNEMGINFASELTDNLRVGIQFLSRDLGELGNNEVTVDWAFGDYRYRNWLGIRAGKIKRPYGLYNRIRDVDAARTGIFLPIMVYDDVPRETFTATTGIGIYGMLPFGLSYELQYGTIQIDSEGGTAKNFENGMKTKVTDVDAKNSFTAFLEWKTPLDGLTLAGTMFRFPDLTLSTALGNIDIETVNYVASAEYIRNDFTLSAEYRYSPYKVTLNDKVTLRDAATDAWYSGVSYRFTDLFTLGTYYGEILSNNKNKNPSTERTDWALTARFDINDYWVFKLEGHLMKGLYQVTTLPKDASEDWFLFAAKVTFSF